MSNSIYEVIEFQDKLPVRCYLQTVQYFRLHWHKEIEFLVVLKGAVSVMLQDTVLVLGEGEWAVVSSGLIHATQPTTEPNILLVLQADSEALCGLNESVAGRAFDLRSGDEAQRGAIRRILCAVMLEMVYRQPGYQHKALAMVADVFSRLLRHFQHSQSAVPEGGRLRERERIDRIVGYINAHYASRLSLGDIAREEHLSVNHLSTFIHKTLGMSFGDYVKYIRLKAYMELLYAEPCASLDDIALRCGFSSPQYATALFRDTYQITPGKFRKRLSQISLVRKRAMDADAVMGYIPQFQPDDLSLVFKYAGDESADASLAASSADEEIAISCRENAGAYHASAVRIAAIGRAYEGLLASVREIVVEAKRDLGFTHLRFHGILSDDMMILRPEPSGAVAYSWRLVDELLDFLLRHGIRPFLELTYMPSLLASGDKTVFQWRGNITPPADMPSWKNLIERFVGHCAARYGADEVAQWYFEVWNEPDYRDVSWAGDMQAFFDFYTATARAIRRALPAARVCGPSLSMASDASHRWIGPFLEHCQQKDALPDAFSMHAYPEIVSADTLRTDIAPVSSADGHTQAMRAQDYLTRLLGLAQKQLAARALSIPIIVTEWNVTLKAFNPINDAAFAATSMLKSALEADGADVRMVHWTLHDYIEERPLPAAELCGGFGLTTCRGLRKPTYYAMLALSRLYPRVVRREEGLMITEQGGNLRVLAYNHPRTAAAFDISYTQHASSGGVGQDAARTCRLTLQGVEPGDYVLIRRRYDARLCSPKALLRATGMREPLSDEGIGWLRAASRPLYMEETVSVPPGGVLAVALSLCACSFEFVDIKRIAPDAHSI